MKFDLPDILYDPPPPKQAIMVAWGVDICGANVIRSSWRTIYLRTILSERQNHKCCYCGQRVSKKKNNAKRVATLEHVIPVSRGGKTDLDNCVMACKRCNEKRGNKVIDAEQFVCK